MTITIVQLESATVPTGATAPALEGAATYLAALKIRSDSNYLSTYLTYPATEQVQIVTRFQNPLGSNQVLDYIQPRIRQAFTSYAGFFYPALVTGYVGLIPHGRALVVQNPPFIVGGVGVNPSTFIEYWLEATWQAPDGTSWDDCDYFDILWKLYAVRNIDASGASVYFYGTTSSGIYHQASWGSLELEVSYTQLPVVGSISPSGGSVNNPQPEITWATSAAVQSSYQVAVVPQGAVDANGVVAGAAGFDPSLVDLEWTGWDSGKVTSGASSTRSSVSLPNGNYRAYVRAWTTSAAIPHVRGGVDRVGAWASGSVFSIAADNVDQPAIQLLNDSSTYTVRVTISPGPHQSGYQLPHFYEVQYQDPEGTWQPANIEDGRTAGNTTTLFYDALVAPGQSISYRARGRYIRADSLQAVTAWVTVTLASSNKKEWWLRCLADQTLNRSLSNLSALALQSWEPSRRRPQTVGWGIGSRFAVVTQDVVKSATMSLRVWAIGASARTALLALLEHDGDLVLVSPFAELWRVRVGEEVEETQLRAGPQAGESTPLGLVRQVSFSLVEVG